MDNSSELIFRTIYEQRGCFFIAGRAKQMPDQVRLSLKNALIRVGKFDDVKADEYLAKMEMDNRYQTETWS